jgi:hypothetical protein
MTRCQMTPLEGRKVVVSVTMAMMASFDSVGMIEELGQPKIREDVKLTNVLDAAGLYLGR